MGRWGQVRFRRFCGGTEVAGGGRDPGGVRRNRVGAVCIEATRNETWQLTVFHTADMVIHMKTTLNISDVTMREVKREAARRQQTMSEMVEAALRTIVEPAQRGATLPPLPEFSSGGLRVNVASRDVLYEVMGG